MIYHNCKSIENLEAFAFAAMKSKESFHTPLLNIDAAVKKKVHFLALPRPSR